MNSFKNLINKITREEVENENSSNEVIFKCRYCNNVINSKEAYIDKEELNVFCSKYCFIEYLKSKYF